MLNKQIAIYKDTSSVNVFLAEIGLSHILFFNVQSIPLDSRKLLTTSLNNAKKYFFTVRL